MISLRLGNEMSIDFPLPKYTEGDSVLHQTLIVFLPLYITSAR